MQFDVTFHPQWWHRHAGICFSEAFFFDENYRIAADMTMRRTLYEKFGIWEIGEAEPEERPVLGSDLIASGFLYSELLGCKVNYGDDIPPEVICANLGDDDAWRLHMPELESNVLWQRIEGQILRLKQRYGYVESALNLQGILNIALDLRGGQIFIDFYENPELARHILDVCYKLSVAVGNRLRSESKALSGGVTAIVKKIPVGSGIYVHSNCSVEMVSQECYEEFLLLYDRMLAEQFQPYGIHHCGQSMEHVVKGYAKVENMQFAEVGAGSNVAVVREALPNVHLNLRYSPARLASVTKDELQKDLAKMYKDSGATDSMLSISCVGIDAEMPDSQVHLFLEVCSGLRGKN